MNTVTIDGKTYTVKESRRVLIDTPASHTHGTRAIYCEVRNRQIAFIGKIGGTIYMIESGTIKLDGISQTVTRKIAINGTYRSLWKVIEGYQALPPIESYIFDTGNKDHDLALTEQRESIRLAAIAKRNRAMEHSTQALQISILAFWLFVLTSKHDRGSL